MSKSLFESISKIERERGRDNFSALVIKMEKMQLRFSIQTNVVYACKFLMLKSIFNLGWV